MTGKEIMDKVFDITFKKGNYSSQIKPLDAQGMIGRTQTISILMLLLETIDDIQDRLLKLENATSNPTQPKSN